MSFKHRRISELTIAFTGVVDGVKERVAEAVAVLLEPLLKRDVQIVHAVVPGTVKEAKDILAVEGAYMNVERKVNGHPKILVRSIVDRYAAAKLYDLDIDLYFSRLFAGNLSEYDLLAYFPPALDSLGPLFPTQISESDWNIRLDKEIRKLIHLYELPVQVIGGDPGHQCEMIVQSVKLRLGLDW